MSGMTADMLFAGTIFVIIVGITVFILHQDRQQTGLLIRQAQKRRGTIKKRFLDYPQLIFFYEGAEVLVNFYQGGKHSPTYTILKTMVPLESDQHIQIFPNSRMHRIFYVRTKIGSQDIQIHEPNFDSAFIVRTNGGDFVRRLLTMEIRNRLLNWKSRQKNIVLEISLEKKRMQFLVYRRLDKDEDYDFFIETGLMILKRLKEIG